MATLCYAGVVLSIVCFHGLSCFLFSSVSAEEGEVGSDEEGYLVLSDDEDSVPVQKLRALGELKAVNTSYMYIYQYTAHQCTCLACKNCGKLFFAVSAQAPRIAITWRKWGTNMLSMGHSDRLLRMNLSMDTHHLTQLGYHRNRTIASSTFLPA